MRVLQLCGGGARWQSADCLNWAVWLHLLQCHTGVATTRVCRVKLPGMCLETVRSCKGLCPLTIPCRVPWCWGAARWPEQLHLCEWGRGQLSFLALPGSQPGADCVCLHGLLLWLPTCVYDNDHADELGKAACAQRVRHGSSCGDDTAVVLLPNQSQPALRCPVRSRDEEYCGMNSKVRLRRFLGAILWGLGHPKEI